MWNGCGFNEGEIYFILSWFWVHQSILHSWGDISVLLLLWLCSWGFSSVPSGQSRFLTSLMGNTALLGMKCWGIWPHLAARGKSHVFSWVAAGTWCIISSYGGDGHLKLGFVQRSQHSCLVMTDTSGSSTLLGRKIQTLLEVCREAKHPLLVGTVILVFLSIFTKSQASSTFEALNSVHLSKFQMDVRPYGQKRLRTMAFSRVSTVYSDIPSSFEMKDEPAFKALHEKPAFFWVRASGVHYTWGRKHRVALTYLFLGEGSSWGACGKLAYLFSQRQIIILIPRRYGVHGGFLKLL